MVMLEILRPQKIEVRIFGQVYALRRIPLGETIDLLQAFIAEGASKVSLDWEPLRRLLRLSFPGFDEWNELGASEEMDLLLIAFEANDFARLIENCTTKILPKLPK